MASRPAGARHDADICPICVDKASQVEDPTASRIPPAAGSPDVSNDKSPTITEGGTTNPMSDMSQETHEALLTKAVADATSVTETALQNKTNELAAANEKVTELETEVASLKADNDRLNRELDTAEVARKAAEDEVAALKSDIASKEEAAAKAELASKRAEEVKNLKLFGDEYVAEKASAWADLADEDWASRMEEWQKIAKPAAGEATTDSASALTGTSEDLTKGPQDTASESTNKIPARRAALGLA